MGVGGWLYVRERERDTDRQTDRQRQTECENPSEIKVSHTTMTDQSMAGRRHIWSENDIKTFDLSRSQKMDSHGTLQFLISVTVTQFITQCIPRAATHTALHFLHLQHNPVCASSVLNPLPHLSR